RAGPAAVREPPGGPAAQPSLVPQADGSDVARRAKADARVADPLPLPTALRRREQRLAAHPLISGERLVVAAGELEGDLPREIDRPAQEGVARAEADVPDREPERRLWRAESREIAGLLQHHRKLGEDGDLIVEAGRELRPAREPRVDARSRPQPHRLVLGIESDLQLQHLVR